MWAIINFREISSLTASISQNHPIRNKGTGAGNHNSKSSEIIMMAVNTNDIKPLFILIIFSISKLTSHNEYQKDQCVYLPTW